MKFHWENKTNDAVTLLPRYGHAAVAAEDRKAIYVFGGVSNDLPPHSGADNDDDDEAAAVYFGDLLKLSLVDFQWSVVAQKGDVPQKREGHSLSYIGNSQLLLFGGSGDPDSEVCFNTVHVLDLNTHTWSLRKTSGQLPKPRLNHSASFVNGNLYVFGGFCEGEASGELFALDTASFTWSRPAASGKTPAPRCDHSSAVVGNKVYLFGGSGGINVWFNDLCCLDTETLAWSTINATGAVPKARDFCSMCSFVHEGVAHLIIFGGANESEDTTLVHFNDLHVFNTAQQTWTKLNLSNSPSVRWGHSASIVGSTMYVIGGTSEEADFRDVFALHLPEQVASTTAPGASAPTPAAPSATLPAAATSATAPATAPAPAPAPASVFNKLTLPETSYATPTPIPAPAPVIEPKVIPESAVSSDVYAAIDALEHSVLSTLGGFFHKLREQHAHIDHQLLQLEENKRALEAARTAQSEIFAQQQREVDDLVAKHKKENESWLAEKKAEIHVQRAALDAEWTHLRAEQQQLVSEREAFVEKSKKMEAIMKQFQGLTL